MPSWLDEGVQVRVFTALDNQAFENGIRTEYPFQTGGTNGNPAGWSRYTLGGTGDWTKVNVTTAEGRWSVSNAVTPPVLLSGQYWGMQRRFDITPGKTYLLNVQARSMEGKNIGGIRRITLEGWYQGAYVASWHLNQWVALGEWENISIRTPDPIAAGIDQVNVILFAGSDTTPAIDWGVQFQNLSLIEVIPPPTLTWHEITCDVIGVSMRYGREKYGERYDVATMTVTVQNDSGRYAYNDPHEFNLRPGRHIKGTFKRPDYYFEYPLFYGLIDSLVDGFSLDGRAVCTISALDTSTTLANIATPTSSTASTMEEYSHLRVARILQSIGWKLYTSANGQWIQQAVQGSGRSIRDEIEVSAESEGGTLYTDTEGKIFYRGRAYTNAMMTNVTANLVATPIFQGQSVPIIDQIPDLPGEIPTICPDQLTTDWSRARILNIVSLANQGGVAFTFEDDESQKKYGPYTYQRHDYVNSNGPSYSSYLPTRAADIMNGYAEAVLRVNSVGFNPTGNRQWRWLIENLWLNYLVRVWYVHPTGKWAFAVVTHVQSIEHRIGIKQWETTLTLDQPISFVRVNLSDRGWDTALWDQDIWDG